MNNDNSPICFININDVLLIPPVNIKCKKIFDIKPEKIIISGIDYIYCSTVANGTYGHVFMYANTKIKIAIKMSLELSDIQMDIDVLKRLENKNCTVLVETIVCDYEYFIDDVEYKTKLLVMDFYDGTLDNFTKKILYKMDNFIKYTSIFKIIRQLVISVKFLFDNNLYYTDIKTSNIMLKLVSFSSIKLALCDYGSALPINGDYIMSYPTIKHKNGNGFIIENEIEQYDLLWGIGVVILNICVDKNKKSINFLTYENIRKFEDDQIWKGINEIIEYILNDINHVLLKNEFKNVFEYIFDHNFVNEKKSLETLLDKFNEIN